MKVHITLVGGQPTPVYQGIVYSKPDLVILVCSQYSLSLARSIKEQLPMYPDKFVEIKIIADSDGLQFKSELSRIIDDVNKSDELSVNLSSGTKAWSIVCFELVRSKRSDANVYCIGQGGILFRFNDIEKKEFVLFDMDTQFKLLGNPLEYYRRFSDYSEKDKSASWKIRRTYLDKKIGSSNGNKMRKLTDSFVAAKYDLTVDPKHTDPRTGNSVLWHPADNKCTLLIGDDEYEFSADHLDELVFKADWFEFEVARLLADKFGADNVYRNCIFKSKDGSDDKNEVDVIVNIGKKLLFVECKTQITQLTDIDKFTNVVHSYGGLGSMALFVTMFPMTNTQIEKCKDSNIEHFYLYNGQIYRPLQATLRTFDLYKTIGEISEKWNIK